MKTSDSIQMKISDQIRAGVREVYGEIGRGASRGCCAQSCCEPAPNEQEPGGVDSVALGYDPAALASVPEVA